MDNLNNIPNAGNWGDAASKLNDNFNKIKQSLTTVENTSKNNKGYFTSLSALNTAFPSPKAGQTAYVYNEASSTNYYIYNAVNGAWTSSTVEAPSVGVDLAAYTKTGGSTKTTKEVEVGLISLIDKSIQIDFVQGSISNIDGSDFNSSNRIRTDFLPIDFWLRVEVPATHKIGVRVYDENKSFIETLSWGVRQGNFKHRKGYVRFIMAYEDDSLILPEQGSVAKLFPTIEEHVRNEIKNTSNELNNRISLEVEGLMRGKFSISLADLSEGGLSQENGEETDRSKYSRTNYIKVSVGDKVESVTSVKGINLYTNFAYNNEREFIKTLGVQSGPEVTTNTSNYTIDFDGFIRVYTMNSTHEEYPNVPTTFSLSIEPAENIKYKIDRIDSIEEMAFESIDYSNDYVAGILDGSTGALAPSSKYNVIGFKRISKGDKIEYSSRLLGEYAYTLVIYDKNKQPIYKYGKGQEVTINTSGVVIAPENSYYVSMIGMNSTHDDYIPYEFKLVVTGLKNRWAEETEIVESGAKIAIEKIDNLMALQWEALEIIPGPTDIPKGANKTGVVYSSARRHDKFVGSYISVQTYLSALKNKNSVMYTERLDDNLAWAYYGAVCSTLLAYALGMKGAPFTNHWKHIEGMDFIYDKNQMQPADILLTDRGDEVTGHVKMIYSVNKVDGVVVSFVTVETNSSTGIIKRNATSISPADDLMRYSKLNENRPDIFRHDFTAEPFLNVDLGNKSNYKLGETVKVSRFDNSYSHIVGTRNGVAITAIPITAEVTNLSNLTVGNYVIRLSKGETPTSVTPPIEFKVVDSVVTSTVNGSIVTINFASNSGHPVWMNWNDPERKSPLRSREITGMETNNKFLTDTFRSGSWMIKIYFENEFGKFTSEEQLVTIP